jgi:hypothetical protein
MCSVLCFVSMIILSKAECVDWMNRYNIALDNELLPIPCGGASHRLRGNVPSHGGGALYAMRQIESILNMYSECLVWISDWGIFPSNENLQLFYRYRHSYGDSRLLSSAPGHLCLGYERAEIVSLAWLCSLQGWDVHIIPDSGSGSVFISHDEWFVLGYESAEECEESRKHFATANIELQPTAS